MTTLATWETEDGCYLAADGRATRGQYVERDDVEKWQWVGPDRAIAVAGPFGLLPLARAVLEVATDVDHLAIQLHKVLEDRGWSFAADDDEYAEVVALFGGAVWEIDVALGTAERAPTPSFHGSGASLAAAAFEAAARMLDTLEARGVDVEVPPADRLRAALEVAASIDLCTGGEITVWGVAGEIIQPDEELEPEGLELGGLECPEA